MVTALVIAISSFTAAGSAFANGYVHSENTEKGYKVVPEHFKSDKTRAEVQAETSVFVREAGFDSFNGNNYPPMDTSERSTKTREQVISEYANEKPEARKARLDLYLGR